MARVVRKVSGKAVRGQKKGLLYSKKFWISTVAAVLVVVAVVLGLVFGLGGSTSDEVEAPDYFAKDYTVTTVLPKYVEGKPQYDKDEDGKYIPTKDIKVSFKKASYAEVVMHTNDNNDYLYNQHTFVFATDLSTFFPEDVMDGDKVAKEKNEEHAKILDALILLQAEIDNYNKYFSTEGQPNMARLFIVDTREALGSDNKTILTDTKFGGAEGTTLLLSLVSNEEVVKSFKDEVNGKTKNILCTTSTASAVQESVNASRSFIRQGFVDAK